MKVSAGAQPEDLSTLDSGTYLQFRLPPGEARASVWANDGLAPGSEAEVVSYVNPEPRQELILQARPNGDGSLIQLDRREVQPLLAECQRVWVEGAGAR